MSYDRLHVNDKRVIFKQDMTIREQAELIQKQASHLFEKDQTIG